MPNFVENVPCRDLGLLLSFVWFYDGPNWPPTPSTKFEVDTFSHCINIKGKPQIYGSSPSLGPRPSFLRGGILWWDMANSSSIPNLKSLASAVAEILKGDSKIVGSFPSSGPRPLFSLGVILWWSLTNLSCAPNLKLLQPLQKYCREPQNFGFPLAQGQTNFFWGGFGDGLWKTDIKLISTRTSFPRGSRHTYLVAPSLNFY